MKRWITKYGVHIFITDNNKIHKMYKKYKKKEDIKEDIKKYIRTPEKR